MTKLSIIILSYNTKDLTLQCIASVIRQCKKELEDKIVDIIVVDNASSDGSPSEISRLRQDFGGQANLKLIENKENVGFAKGCNIGVREAKGKYLLFLNSDTKAEDRGFLKMVEFLDTHERVGILGGKLLDPNGSPQSSAGKFYTLPNFLLMIIGGERFGWLRSSPKKITRVEWVSGACMMVAKKTFETLHGFDEHFFMYMEDMELCFRAANSDFSTYFFPDVKLIHQALGSSNRAFAVRSIREGILYFYKKHESYWQYFIVKTLLAAKSIIA